MPGHKAHRYVDKLLFGKEYTTVHEAIDRPYIAYGRGHRRFFHTYPESYVLGSIASGDAWSGTAGITHVWLDNTCSKDKTFRKCLEGAVALDELAEEKQENAETARTGRTQTRQRL